VALGGAFSCFLIGLWSGEVLVMFHLLSVLNVLCKNKIYTYNVSVTFKIEYFM
jgi:hypothetical protein